MMKRLYIFILLLFVHSPLFLAQTNKKLYFNDLSVKDGLSQGTVHCIWQDKPGFMWFGTGDGLNRYDGYTFTTHKHNKNDSTSISNNIINCIAEDEKGNLWIGTTDGLNCYNPVKETFIRYFHDDNDPNSLSNNYVKSLHIDSHGTLWIGTDVCLNRLDDVQGTFTKYDFDGKIINSRIYDIHEDTDGDLWLATRNSGIIRFNPEYPGYKQYSNDPANISSISADHVYIIYEDSSHELWFGTWEHGVNKYDRENDCFLRIQAGRKNMGLNNNQIRCIMEKTEGELWIGTFEGLNIFNMEENAFSYCLRDNNVPGSLSYNIINCMFKDNAGSIWVGTNGGGINLYNPILEQFKLIDPKLKANHNYGFIGPMAEHKGKIWIGTEGGGLAAYDFRTDNYSFFNMDNVHNESLNSNTIKALCIDKQDHLWIGTYAGGIKTFNLNTMSFGKNYDSFSGIDNNIVNDIFEDTQGNIWVGSNSAEGIHLKEDKKNNFTRGFEMKVKSERVDFPWIRAICEPNTDEIWFGSIYYGIFIYKNGHTTQHISTANSNLSSDYISFIFEDSEELIWIGTYGGGINIYNPETDDIRTYTTKHGLLNDNICCIMEDSLSNIWICTIAGLSKYTKGDDNFTNFSYLTSSFPIETLNLKAGLYASDGQMYVGGNNGIVSFYPEQTKINEFVPPVHITRITINGQVQNYHDNKAASDNSIHLTYDQSNINVEFSALNYLFPESNQYRYYLEGYESSWNNSGNQHNATYTNLLPGQYTLKVMGSNNSGIWNEEITQLHIHILPPPWRTWWAYLLYFAAFGIILYAIIHYFISKVKFENDIKLKQMEKLSMEQAHQMQMNLFTNFSHELRTPLTLIIDPLKGILADDSLPAVFKSPLQMIYKNAGRILQLVNQLMDLRKQGSGKLTLKTEEGDIVKFIREMSIIFRELTQPRNIRLTFTTKESKIKAWYDPFLMEKVFYNLLSNAIKFTPEGGSIEMMLQLVPKTELDQKQINKLPVNIQGIDKFLFCSVQDSGKGIPEKDLENIFTPFFQVNDNNLTATSGTGIGLHLTQGIVEKHYGHIWAENRKQGGAIFNLLLPLDPTLFYSSGTDSPGNPYKVDTFKLKEEENEAGEKELITDSGKPVVLVVDDNPDIRTYIRMKLQQDYIIYEAENGQAGLEIASDIVPDIILSDIMMPVMDGLELCARLKKDIHTSHIPVILLTARTTIMQVEEGFRTGADEYITKPFDADLLIVRIRNILENRKRVKDSYIRNFNIELPEKVNTNLDDLFMKRAYDFVKQHLNDSELSIEEFGRQMYLSRTQLYRKIKALTGMSPSMFISTLRLKVAAELLAEGEWNVSEICYRVGFSSPSYFTTSFKKLYNVSPTEYIQIHKKH